MSLKYIPKFCVDCGARVEWSKRSHHTYDKQTGEEIFIQRLICPNNRWWKIAHRDPISAKGFRYSIPYYRITKEKSQ